MRSITLEKIGTISNERYITLIKLKNNNNMQVDVMNGGAKIVSIKLPNGSEISRELREDYENCFKDSSESKINRVNESHLNTWSLTEVAGQLDEIVWDYELLEDGDGVLFSTAPDTGDNMVRIRKAVILTDANEIIVEYSGNMDKDEDSTDFLSFNLNGMDSELCEHEFEVSANHWLVQTDDNIDSLVYQLPSTSSSRFSVGADKMKLNRIYHFEPMEGPNKLRDILKVSSNLCKYEINIFSTLSSCFIRNNHDSGEITVQLSCQESIVTTGKSFITTQTDEFKEHTTIYRFSV